MIYTDPVKKTLYESCTTRLVLEDLAEIRELSKLSAEKVVFFDIPLLFETGTENDYDEIWVVTADADIRKRRIIERSNLDEATIEHIMSLQASDEDKVAKADRVIYNNGTIEDLNKAVDNTLKNFLK